MSDDSQEVSAYLHLFVSRAFSLSQVFVRGAVSKVCLRLRGEYSTLCGISMKRENVYNNFTRSLSASHPPLRSSHERSGYGRLNYERYKRITSARKRGWSRRRRNCPSAKCR